jgi:crotonobetainyl-CoA:carnitine CoA-transferase CaiB-like acyl-CoA transferase
MMAHMHRTVTGKGQYVDVSCQEATTRALANAPQSYALEGSIINRQGAYRQTGRDTYMRLTWPCQDGYVNFQFSGGTGSGRGVNNLVQWMSESGHGDAYLESIDFTQLGYGTLDSAMLERVVPPIENFIASLTKDELFKGAVDRRILLFPVATPQDIVENPQLAARSYFQEVTHPDLGTPVTFLGPPVGVSETPITYRRFPPKLGEHNAEIYGAELGLQTDELARLREANTI